MVHSLVTSYLLTKAQKKEDGGRCKLCGKYGEGEYTTFEAMDPYPREGGPSAAMGGGSVAVATMPVSPEPLVHRKYSSISNPSAAVDTRSAPFEPAPAVSQTTSHTVLDDEDVQFEDASVHLSEQCRVKSPVRSQVDCYHSNPVSSPTADSRSPNATAGRRYFDAADLTPLGVGSTTFKPLETSSSFLVGAEGDLGTEELSSSTRPITPQMQPIDQFVNYNPAIYSTLMMACCVPLMPNELLGIAPHSTGCARTKGYCRLSNKRTRDIIRRPKGVQDRTEISERAQPVNHWN